MFARVAGSLAGSPHAARDAVPAAPEGRTTWIADWPGWAPLQRRLRLLQEDAAQVALSHAAVGDALGRG